MELPSRAKKLLLLAGAGCTMIGGLVLWKDTVAGKKIEQIKTETEIKVKRFVEKRHSMLKIALNSSRVWMGINA